MKNKIFNALVSLTLLAGLTACNEKWEPNSPKSDEMGTLSTANLIFDLANIEKVNAPSRATNDYSNYIITVENAQGEIVEEWTYGTMPSLPMFQVGDYKLNVESHIPESWAWDMPHFKGSLPFTIEANKVTAIGTVTCKLQSLKVSVIFEEELTKASDGDLQCEINVNQDNLVKFVQSEKRSCYFVVPEGNSTMVATFKGTVNGYKEEIVKVYDKIDQAVGKHFIIRFSLKGGGPVVPPIEQGQWDPSEGISVDVNYEEENLAGDAKPGDEDVINGDRPGEEEWGNGGGDDPDPGPSVDPTPDPGEDAAATFTSETLNLTGVNNCDVSPAVVNISCPNGIENLFVTINSDILDNEALGEFGLSTHFDLAHPDNQDQEDALRDDLHFQVGADILGKNEATFDITMFLPMLKALDLDGGKNHEFIIEVVDTNGAKSKLSLKFQS